ncbi:Hpt domain-containing protein [Alcanivorax quisquiliarum]|uniref:histidine kinase n=1 Tax=Alcanivorax quisquiliarum TaxID=2933565 RepID=A0ABT0E4U6_9GAMM|nr:Hpt domain-containing protein [Alcanivorax quisquiliarum]MCK0536820.1 Hpt domain-containing protein [Alcanivorax quisquiliarum]
MADRHDYLALDWVKGEIQETLNQAQQALEAFVENPEDSARMRFCQTYLHQVYGTLQMVEFYGAALLAEEMEKLAEALLDDRVGAARMQDAQETLMRAILQLPPYLERIQSSRRDLPLVLLPLLNDLRAARGDNLLSETSLFKPDLAGAASGGAPAPAMADPAFPALMKKIRQTYQVALLGVLRGQKLAESLGYMGKIFARLDQASGEAPHAGLWQAAGALVDGIAAGDIEVGVSVKQVLGQLDRVLRDLAASGAALLATPPATDLLKNLLYYVARSNADSPGIRRLRERFRLDEALPSDELVNEERARMGGPDQAAMGSVVQALSEELSKVKAALEQFAQLESAEPEALQAQSQTLKQVADTIAVLGLGQPRKLIEQQQAALLEMAAGNTAVSAEALMEVAGALLYVEATLAGVSDDRRARTGQLHQVPDHVGKAREAVVRECRAGLEEAKDGIVEFIASQWDQSHLAAVPSRLDAVRGGLQLIQLDRPALVLRQCVAYVSEQLIGAEAAQPDWRSMDTLADAITSVEYYLERLTDDPDTSDDILLLARDSVAALGYPLADDEFGLAVAVEEHAAIQQSTDVAPQTEEIESAVASEEPAPTETELTPVDAALSDTAPAHADTIEALEALSGGDHFEISADDSELAPVAAAAPAPHDDDLIDQEIIDIFVEEAGEVLDALNLYFPRWAADQNDEEALVEFRRAFHTLKGSGRMVGAHTIGELAWAIENMMNRVIDNSVTATPMLIDLVRAVHGLVPELVNAFANGQPDPCDVTPLREAAETLAAGGELAAIPSPGDIGTVVAEPALQHDPAPAETPAPEATEGDETAAWLIDEAQSDASMMLQDVEEIVFQAPPQWPEEGDVEELTLSLPGEAGAALPTEEEPASTFPAEPVASESIPDEHRADSASLDKPAADEPASQLLAEADSPSVPALPADEVDPVLLDIFRNEAAANLALIRDWLHSLDNDFSEHPMHDSVHRALHTLKGSARMAEIEAVAQVAEPAEKFIKDMINGNALANRDITALLEDVLAVISAGLSQPHPDMPPLPGSEALLARIAMAHDTLSHADERSDQHILSVFLSEGMDLIVDADQLLEQWLRSEQDTAELVPLRDELALLGGSAATAGLMEISVLAAALADGYSAIIDYRLRCDDHFVELAEQAHEALMTMMDFLAAGQTIRPTPELVQALRDLLDDSPAPARADSTDSVASAGLDSTGMDSASETLANAYESDADPELIALFLEEAVDILASVSDSLDAWEQGGDVTAVAVLQRELHTLKGGAGMAGVRAVVDLAHELEYLYEGVVQGRLAGSAPLFTLLHQCHDRLADMLDALGEQQPVLPAPDLVAAVQHFLATGQLATDQAGHAVETGTQAPEAQERPAVTNEPTPPADTPAHDAFPSAAFADDSLASPAHSAPERDQELVDIFLEEADEILESVAARLDAWMKAPDNLIEVQSLQRDLHTLKGGARMAELVELGDLGHELENLYEGLAQGSLKAEPVLFELLHRCHDRLAFMLEAVRRNEAVMPASELLAAIAHYIADPAGFSLPAEPGTALRVPSAPQAPAPVQLDGAQVATEDLIAADADIEILQIFIDESAELCELIDEHIGAWRETPGSLTHADEIKRALHTLKGGARLAGLKALGDTSHDFEQYLLDNVRRNQQPDAGIFQALQTWQERISTLLDAIRAAVPRPPIRTNLPAGADNTEAAPAVSGGALAVEPAPQADARVRREERQRRQQQPQEMVRVASELLEALVNLAGETSINRGRVEQGLSEFSAHVEEMGHTVERLYEQLRRLDAETEAQILSNYKQGVETGQYNEDFDPLEMDQYSELHQITKQLSESASDLLDLKSTLLDRTKDTETLLLQQARINTELQEKLMRTRMVPFARLVPRLRRVVRQVSGELGKRVEFDVINPEGELDRTLLERVVAPLEHMLRNAVDHGIEMPDIRTGTGKQPSGRITLELGREGGEVVLVLSDDGKGIDTNAVRTKAIERGLIDAGTDLSDQEIQQFIFNAGFSTAAKVTQVSGRGVGMDVVASEIKQMGGSVTIESQSGQGTRFVIRLPFTLAMNRALMVRVGEDSYAIPLNQIEGIVRISPYELEAYFETSTMPFTYAGQQYDFEYLGNFVHGVLKPNLDNQVMPMPVLLIRSSEHTVAVLVDALVGSREVVVKSVGPQLATVAGISGATILGDGSVVIILDIHSLIRAAHMQRQHQAVEVRRAAQLEQHKQREEAERERAARVPVVMVTDDSVTVRKVTTRLLERNGYEVITAKDGMDAIAMLEEQRPDLMLLDIEMPRMDGFEVAMHVRHDNRLEDVPIIMITSRTGEKHRDRAFDIGVNAYMGKPFQENELLATIAELLAQARDTADT